MSLVSSTFFVCSLNTGSFCMMSVPGSMVDNLPGSQTNGAAWCWMQGLQNYDPLLCTKPEPRVFCYSNRSALRYLTMPVAQDLLQSLWLLCDLNLQPGHAAHCLFCNVSPSWLYHLSCLSRHLVGFFPLLGSLWLTSELFSGWHSKPFVAVSATLQSWLLFCPHMFPDASRYADTPPPDFSWGDGSSCLFTSDKALITGERNKPRSGLVNQW